MSHTTELHQELSELVDGKYEYQNLLEKLQKIVYEINAANGWFDANRSFGDDIALLHSEVSEAFEAYRDDKLERFYRTTKDGPKFYIDDSLDFNYMGYKPEGVASEAADQLVRLLDFCERHEIDLFAETISKLAYNRSRGYRHGNKAL